MDKQEEERRNACTQTTYDEEELGCWQLPCTRITCGTQTSAFWYCAEEEQEVASGFGLEEQEQRGIHSSSLAGACLRDNGVEEGPSADEKHAVESRHMPFALPAKLQGNVPRGAVERRRMLDFAELQWKLEQLKGRTSPARECSQRGPSGSTPKTKSEAQLLSIVKSIQKKMPHCSEAEIRCHLNQVRRIQGGFSLMTLGHIRALVLSHMENKNGNPEPA